MKLGLLQLHITADIADNKTRLAEGIIDLAKRGAELIVLQELHNTLYFCQIEDVENFDLAEPIPGPSTEFYGRLAKDLGVPLPWLRLSVVGSLSYETIAASNAEGAMGLVFGQVDSLTASQYVTIAWVMTISIMLGIWLVPLIGKKLQGGMTKIENRDKRWGDILSSALFIGMIAAFLGYVFCDFGTIFHGDPSGLIPVCVMIVSAIIMALCGLIMKKTGWHWVGDYALPMSLILGMASAIPITGWLS